MSEVKHTPGPWTAHIRKHWSDGTTKTTIGQGSGFGVAEVLDFQGVDVAANARLIAAAPDLFRSSQMLLELLWDYSDEIERAVGGAAPALRLILKDLSSAVEQVEGKEPANV